MSQVPTTPGGPSQKCLQQKMLEAEERKKHPEELEEIQIIIKYNVKKEEKEAHRKTSIRSEKQETEEQQQATHEDSASINNKIKTEVKQEVKQEIKQEYLTSSDDEDKEEEEEDDEEQEFHEEEIYPSPLNYSYFSRQNRSCLSNLPLKTQKEKRRFDTEEKLLKYLDKVDVQIIASVDTSELFHKAPTFAQPMIALTINLTEDQKKYLNEKFQLPLDYTDDGLPRRESPKGELEEPREFLDHVMASAIFQMMHSDPKQRQWLFQHIPSEATRWQKQQFDKNNNNESNFFYANLFLVDKTSFLEEEEDLPADQKIPVQRMIVDARIANHFLENLAPMELFSLEALIRVMGRMFKQQQIDMKTIYTLSADLRHWFHQLPLPQRFYKHYALRHPKDHEKIFFPRVWPMGASPAPGIGQSVTWSMLLHNLEIDPCLKESLGIVWPGDFDVIPPWIPLSCGGAVFVLIDNIFVVTSNSKFSENWRTRIFESTKYFKATLKNVADHEKFKNDYDKKIQKVNFHHSSHEKYNPYLTVEFSGILFSHTGVKAKNAIEEDEQLRNEASEEWRGTYRGLAAIIGKSLWIMRVSGKKMYQMSEYRQICEIAFPKKEETWDTAVVITGKHLDALRSLYNNNGGSGPLQFSPYLPQKEVNNIAFLATDACYHNETAGHGWIWQMTGERAISGSTSRTGKSQIGIEELRAVVLAIKQVKKYRIKHHLVIPDSYIIAVDSMHARGMIIHGTAKTRIGRKLLQLLDHHLEGANLLLTFVKSNDNPADAPSRGEPAPPDKWNKLVNSFNKLKYLLSVKVGWYGKNITENKHSYQHLQKRREREINDNKNVYEKL